MNLLLGCDHYDTTIATLLSIGPWAGMLNSHKLWISCVMSFQAIYKEFAYEHHKSLRCELMVVQQFNWSLDHLWSFQSDKELWQQLLWRWRLSFNSTGGAGESARRFCRPNLLITRMRWKKKQHWRLCIWQAIAYGSLRMSKNRHDRLPAFVNRFSWRHQFDRRLVEQWPRGQTSNGFLQASTGTPYGQANWMACVCFP